MYALMNPSGGESCSRMVHIFVILIYEHLLIKGFMKVKKSDQFHNFYKRINKVKIKEFNISF